MAAFNKIILMGNLTKDPELRYTGGGSAVCSFRLAVNRAYKTQTGELRDDTCYIDITAWGKAAENCNNYLRKGAPVLVEGYLRYETWTDKASGQNRSRHSVSAETVRFLGTGQQNATQDGHFSAPQQQNQNYNVQAHAQAQTPQPQYQAPQSTPMPPAQPYQAPKPVQPAPAQNLHQAPPPAPTTSVPVSEVTNTPQTPTFDPPPMPDFESEVEDDIPF